MNTLLQVDEASRLENDRASDTMAALEDFDGPFAGREEDLA